MPQTVAPVQYSNRIRSANLPVISPSEKPSTSDASPPAPVRVAVQNVGCKLNQYEAEALMSGFADEGFEIVAPDCPADVYVVNTCTVTGSGDADSRKALRRGRRTNPDAILIATGCYAQRRPDELREAGAQVVIGNGQKVDLIRHVQTHLAGEQVPDFDPDTRPRRQNFLAIGSAKPSRSTRTRGTLQIQDGCDEHCTYCIIPAVRGPSVSRPMDEIILQAQRMVDGGYRELALTGVHSGSYGQEIDDGSSLVTLLKKLEPIDGLERIRLNSVEPACVTDELIEFAASPSKLCRHFHVPMQSGDDQVLKRMGRRYDAAFYSERIHRLSDAVPDCALGADIMVGFPGEDDSLFENTFAFTRELPLTYLHVFSYSARDETPALKLDNHVDRAPKRSRAARLIKLSESKKLAFHSRFVGARVSVLVEEIGSPADWGLASGLTDNYIKVRFLRPPGLRPNEMVEVTLTQAREDVAFGDVDGSER